MRYFLRSVRIALSLVLFLFGAALSAQTKTHFQPAPNGVYRISNQFSGMLLTGYLDDLSADHWTDDSKLRSWSLEPAGTNGIFYLKQREYPAYAYVSNGDAKLNYHISTPPTDATADHYKWEIKRVTLPDGRNPGFYTIQNVGSQTYLTFDINLSVGNLRAEKAPIRMQLLQNSKTQYWKFYHEVNDPIDTLSIPQGGWDSHALNKIALLTRSSKGGTISYSVTGPQSISGTAIYWGQYWNDKHYYILNLNGVTRPGTYTLTCDGKTTTFRIGDDLYTRPFREEGSDHFDISEIFDNTYGFVGHWGRIATWWNKGLDSAPVTELGWRNANDPSSPTNWWKTFSPSRPIAQQMALKAYSGGWDMTDQEYHEWALDGDILKDLALFYTETADTALKSEILEELTYGVKGLLANQESDGKWRQGVVEGSVWFGTTAKLGGGLAAAARVLAATHPDLAARAKQGAADAWNYLYPQRLDRSRWAIKGEGVNPDGTTLTAWPQHHRHGYAGSYLEFAVELYLLNGDAEAKSLIDDIINRAMINPNVGQLYAASGQRFPGQILNGPGGTAYSFKSKRAIMALIKYYDHATPEQQGRIMEMLRTYYRYEIYDYNNGNKRLDGPAGMFEGDFYKGGDGGQWTLPMRLLLSTLLYDRFGPEFGRGVIVSQRAFDYWTGVNPYATSLLLGVGDEFQVGGWSSYHALGRHVGLLPIRGTTKLYSSFTDGNKGYMARETTAAGGVKLWLGLTLMQKLSATMPFVTLYTGKSYRGSETHLVAGDYLLRHLKAYGLDADTLSSLKVPNGFTVTLYDGDNFSGSTQTVTADTSDLGSMDNRVKSVKISYTAPATVNSTPHFSADPLDKPSAVVDSAYSETLVGTAVDSDGDRLSYTKLSGPAWLHITNSGMLSGTPTASDIGENRWQIKVSDSNGSSDTATLHITVKAKVTGGSGGGTHSRKDLIPKGDSGGLSLYDQAKQRINPALLLMLLMPLLYLFAADRRRDTL